MKIMNISSFFSEDENGTNSITVNISLNDINYEGVLFPKDEFNSTNGRPNNNSSPNTNNPKTPRNNTL